MLILDKIEANQIGPHPKILCLTCFSYSDAILAAKALPMHEYHFCPFATFLKNGEKSRQIRYGIQRYKLKQHVL